jgi:radical SAM protein with 4Fe4S-binding SPASM domain
LEAQGIIKRDLGVFKNIGPNKRTITVMRKFGVKRTTKAGDTDFDHLSNRSGYVPGFHKELKAPLVRHCTKPFRFLNINWTGDALLCCNDYYGKMSMGNVQASTLMEIWSGEKFNEYRLRLQNKNRNAFLCSTCDSNGGYYPHMVNRVTFGPKQDAKLLRA